MTTIDEVGASAAALARADAARIADIRADADLARICDEHRYVRSTHRPRTATRRWVIVGLVGALLAAAAGVAVVAIRPDRSRQLQPATLPTDEPLTTSRTVGATIPDSLAPPTAGTSENLALTVSNAALPAAYAATAFATVALSGDQTAVPHIAVGDRQAMIVEPGSKRVTVVDWFQPGGAAIDKLGTGQRSFDLPVAPFEIAAGPGEVLYGLVQGDGASMSIVAIALTGDRAGQIVESSPINAVAFVEAPPGVLGHGATGIVDRRTGAQLLPYWNAGSIIPLGVPAHLITISAAADGTLVVHDPDGSHDWNLRIQRDATSPRPILGEALPAPSSNGGAVVWTSVGPPTNSTDDIGVPTHPVMAVLSLDGSGTWYSLSDGWRVAASDLNGTVLSRVVGPNVEVAKIDPPQRYDFIDQPTVPHQRVRFASTLPTTLTTAEPCAAASVEVKPGADGAMGTLYGSLFVHNITTRACQVQGPPDVQFLDSAGNVIQSTDPALLAAATSSRVVVLEPQSWALASLGQIGSNVCGGNESAQLRVSLAGSSTTLEFRVGRPFDPSSCDGSYDVKPRAGQLQVEPFASVPISTGGDPLDRVDIVLEAPTKVRRGETLAYDVLMTARREPSFLIVVIAADECPIYSEMLGGTTSQYLLNCNGGLVIAQGDPVRFHIRLKIANDAPLGPATLAWTTTEPAGHTATANITIEP